MAVGIVDHLEMIEIAQDQRMSAIGSGRQRRPDLPVEAAAIGNARKCIPLRLTPFIRHDFKHEHGKQRQANRNHQHRRQALRDQRIMGADIILGHMTRAKSDCEAGLEEEVQPRDQHEEAERPIDRQPPHRRENRKGTDERDPGKCAW